MKERRFVLPVIVLLASVGWLLAWPAAGIAQLRGEPPPPPAATASPYDAALRRRGVEPDAAGLIGYLRGIKPPEPRLISRLVKQIVIDWGRHGGPITEKGRTNHYVQEYTVSYRTAATPAGKWLRVHGCKVAPAAEPAVLTGTPIVLHYTAAKSTTLIAGLDLRKVIALRLEAGSRANWIGVAELEALGRPEGN